MRVALYARVSTRDKGQNPEMQLDPMRKYCQAMQWQPYGEYVDKNSASDLIHRVEWFKLLQDAAHHKFDILLIWKLDRAFRSVIHQCSTLEQLRSLGIGFHSLMDPSIDTTTPNGCLVLNILGAVAQFEKDLIVVRVNEGIKYAREHGTKSGKPIGRPGFDIPIQEICRWVYRCRGNYTAAANDISITFHEKLDNRLLAAGFVSLRLKRASIRLEDLLQRPGKYFDGF